MKPPKNNKLFHINHMAFQYLPLKAVQVSMYCTKMQEWEMTQYAEHLHEVSALPSMSQRERHSK